MLPGALTAKGCSFGSVHRVLRGQEHQHIVIFGEAKTPENINPPHQSPFQHIKVSIGGVGATSRGEDSSEDNIDGSKGNRYALA